MTSQMKDYLLGMFAGFGLALIIQFLAEPHERSVEEMRRDYAAYSECIPKPHCMKAQDFIDYYNLKWKLQAMSP